jgi:hypothetical protein
MSLEVLTLLVFLAWACQTYTYSGLAGTLAAHKCYLDIIKEMGGGCVSLLLIYVMDRHSSRGPVQWIGLLDMPLTIRRKFNGLFTLSYRY